MKDFEKVIGYEGIKLELARICGILKQPEKYSKFGINSPKGLLLYGVPGVGKTLICEEFIRASGRQVFMCRKNKPDGEFVAEIYNTFDKAKQSAPSIVFLDDMDKFANEDERHRDAEEYVTVQSCIDSVKNDQVFVLATANDISRLPSSLLRAGRFDSKIEVKVPCRADAEKIIAHYFELKNFVSDVDVKFISRILVGKSCAELETVINEAGIIAGFEDKDAIDNDDIIRACMRIIFGAPESVDDISEEALLRIAYHEAGHTVVAEALEPESVNLISVKCHDGEVGGITDLSQSEDYFVKINYMENRVISLLGGKAATEIVYGEADTGCYSDLQRAFRIATRFADDYCAYGFDKWEVRGANSDALLERRNSQVSADMQNYYNRAKKILVDNRALLDALAAQLVKNKVLTYRDIAAIKAQVKAG